VLERFYKTDSTPRRLRDGPAGPFLDGFAESMFVAGYSPAMIGSYLWAAEHVGLWIARRGAAIADLDEDLLARFVRHLLRCRCRGCKRGVHKHVPFRLHAFLRYLREKGVVSTSAPETPRPHLVIEYGAWMRERRGLAELAEGQRRQITSGSVSVDDWKHVLGFVNEDLADCDRQTLGKQRTDYSSR
jgi:hypothetical protein